VYLAGARHTPAGVHNNLLNLIDVDDDLIAAEAVETTQGADSCNDLLLTMLGDNFVHIIVILLVYGFCTLVRRL
jgi:hypothetical protein